jgi:hypothetical protein
MEITTRVSFAPANSAARRSRQMLVVLGVDFFDHGFCTRRYCRMADLG